MNRIYKFTKFFLLGFFLLSNSTVFSQNNELNNIENICDTIQKMVDIEQGFRSSIHFDRNDSTISNLDSINSFWGNKIHNIDSINLIYEKQI